MEREERKWERMRESENTSRNGRVKEVKIQDPDTIEKTRKKRKDSSTTEREKRRPCISNPGSNMDMDKR